MTGLMGVGAIRVLSEVLSPFSPTTYVFASLLSIAVFFATVPDLGPDLAWPLVAVFAILAMSPGNEVEE